jgi:hypothetical protein
MWFKILFPILRRLVAIGVNDVHLLGVAVRIVIIARWPWSFIMLQCFSLLLELAKVPDLWLAEFGKLFVELWNYLWLLPD